jgi:hypothetical protein
VNFGIVLAKSLLNGVPNRWEVHRPKIVLSLVAVRDRASGSWPEISGTIIRLLNQLIPSHRPRAIAFLAAFPDFWSTLELPVRMALQETVNNVQVASFTDYMLLSGVSIPELRTATLSLIERLSAEQVREAIAFVPLSELWPTALKQFAESSSFRGSESNFRDLIVPFLGWLSSQQSSQLLDAIAENGQNWDATGTPSSLFDLVNNLNIVDYPSYEARNRLFRLLQARGRLARYMHIFELFRSDGWSFPGPKQVD